MRPEQRASLKACRSECGSVFVFFFKSELLPDTQKETQKKERERERAELGHLDSASCCRTKESLCYSVPGASLGWYAERCRKSDALYLRRSSFRLQSDRTNVCSLSLKKTNQTDKHSTCARRVVIVVFQPNCNRIPSVSMSDQHMRILAFNCTQKTTEDLFL